jgi:hypothetical protein
MSRNRIVLIGCGKAKAPEACAARDLYTGGLFKDRLAYAEASAVGGGSWFIISAKFGLLAGDTLLRPYDLTIGDLKPVDRAAWVAAVAGRLLDEIGEAATLRDVCVEVHAGEDYAEPLCSVLRALGLSTDRPVEGLGIGSQRKWYRDAAKWVARGLPPPRPLPSESAGAADVELDEADADEPAMAAS